MRNSDPSVGQVEIIARALGDLNEKATFVGGATVALYIDDPGARVPTPTDDVDFTVEIATYHEFSMFEEQLRKLGFTSPDGEERAPICRLQYEGISVDIMPMEGKVLGFSNKWYPDGIKNRLNTKLKSGQVIYYLSLPYFLLTKLEAYFDRGHRDDPRLSQDLEDIAAVLDGTKKLLETITAEKSKSVKAEIASGFAKLLKSEAILKEAFLGALVDEQRTSEAIALAKKLSSLG